MSVVEEVKLPIYDELAVFLANFENDEHSPKFWQDRMRLWWEGNPDFDETHPRGWILRDEGLIVGFLGCIARNFLLHGNETIVYNATTWRVEESYRSESLKLMFKFTALANNSLLFDTTPSPPVVPIIKSLGFEEMPWEGLVRSVYIINARKVLSNRLKRFPLINHVAPVFIPLLFVGQWWFTRKMRRTGLKVKKLNFADASFNELWNRTKNLYQNTLVRNADMINWHCFQHPQRRKTLLACYQKNHLTGYAICTPYESDSLLNYLCIDLWIDPEYPRSIDAITYEMCSQAKNSNCDIVQVAHFDARTTRLIKKTGMRQIHIGRIPSYIKGNNNCLEKISNQSNYFTYFQGDTWL